MASNNENMSVSELGFKLVFTESTPKEQYEKLYNLEIGQVFKIQSGYETVMRRIEDYMPHNRVFKVFPINPGTSLYTIYGPCHCVITDNRVVPPNKRLVWG